MTIRHYSSLDPGAPALSGSLYDRVRQVMLSCLVTGYGAKPAAGWTVGHDVVGGFSLSNGDGVINWVANTADYVGVYIMEAITNGVPALAGGINRRSGIWADGVATSERAYFWQQGGFNGSSNPHWSVTADAKTVIFQVGGGISSANPESYGSGFAHYFGAYINGLGLTGPATFCSLGNGTNQPQTHALTESSRRHGNCLRNPSTGLIDQGAGQRYGASPAIHWRSSSSSSTPLLKPSRLQPIRAALLGHGGAFGGSTVAGSAIAGYLRGLISEPMLSGSLLSDVCGLLDKANGWQSRVSPILMPNGHQWVPIFPHSSEFGLFASLAPSDWE